MKKTSFRKTLRPQKQPNLKAYPTEADQAQRREPTALLCSSPPFPLSSASATLNKAEDTVCPVFNRIYD
jgi:uncharacterized membrane protein